MRHTTLTARDRTRFRQKLLELMQRFQESIKSIEAESLGSTPRALDELDPPAHEAEPAVRVAEDEVNRTALASEEQLLSETRAALARIETGDFGICEECGHMIGRSRLDALPYARECAECARSSRTID
jgi:DnaK suppressor protein